MKHIWIITLFPELFSGFLEKAMAGEFLRRERQVHLLNLRDYAENKYKTVDDAPYGGGGGAIMTAPILKKALEDIVQKGKYSSLDSLQVLFPSPRGEKLTSTLAKKLATTFLLESSSKDLVFICGRYEGVDERFLSRYVQQEISIGDYVLSGGELASMVILETSLRFVPGVLGNKDSWAKDSFEDGLLEHPQYTRPQEWEGMKVPDVLLSGHDQHILDYQKQQKEEMTAKLRPDLFKLWQKK